MADDQNPLDNMFPSADNPEYHRRKAEHQEKKSSSAAQAAIEQHGYLGERMQRVRANPPQAQAPAPAQQASPQGEPEPSTGLTVDAGLASRHSPAPEVASTPPGPAPKPAEAPIETKGHPLLKKLREDFGIDSIPMEEVELNDHKFTMRVLETSSIATALRFADSLSLTWRESNINLQIALVAFSIVAIDGVPTWQVFGIELAPDERVVVEGEFKPVFKPLSPPQRVRILGATAAMDFLNSVATASLSDDLWEFYRTKVDPKASLMAIRDSSQIERDADNVPLP